MDNSDDLREMDRRWASWVGFVTSRGKRYSECRIANFKTDGNQNKERAVELLTRYGRGIAKHIADGVNVTLFGPPGTGKDHLMIGLCYAAIRDAGATIEWVNGGELFGRIRDTMDTDIREKDLIGTYANPDVLVISDPTGPVTYDSRGNAVGGSLTQHQSWMLYRILDKRYSNLKPTWVTVNVSKGSEMAKLVGSQAQDRLRHGSLAIHCDWETYRGGIDW